MARYGLPTEVSASATGIDAKTLCTRIYDNLFRDKKRLAAGLRFVIIPLAAGLRFVIIPKVGSAETIIYKNTNVLKEIIYKMVS